MNVGGKELFMELVAGIQTAADRGDQRGLYSAVKKIAPKTTKFAWGSETTRVQ